MINDVLQDAFDRRILLRNEGELVNDQRDFLIAGVIANILKSSLPITESTEIITRESCLNGAGKVHQIQRIILLLR